MLLSLWYGRYQEVDIAVTPPGKKQHNGADDLSQAGGSRVAAWVWHLRRAMLVLTVS